MKRLAYAAAAVLVLAVAFVLIAPALIDTPAARAEIQRRLSLALGGYVTWESLEIALFPVPRGELRKLRIEIPEKIAATAEDVQIYLRLWPLLRGAPEISSVSVVRPSVRIGAAKGTGSEAPLDVGAVYRAAMEAVAHALREFAPNTALKLSDAEVDVAIPGKPLELRRLNASLATKDDGFELELTTAANLWKRLKAEARVAYADLSARASVELDALLLDQDLPALAAAKGTLLLIAGKPPELAAEVTGVDLAQALAVARRKVEDLDAIESAEGKVSLRARARLEPAWQAELQITQSNAALKLAQLPWKLSLHAGGATITPQQVLIAGANGVLGASTFEHAAARIDLGSRPRLSAASGRATLELAQWFGWLRQKLPLEEIASVSGGADVMLKRLALRFDDPAAADFEAVATPRKVGVALRALPHPVSADGGAIFADSRQVRLDQVAVAMLDARALASGTLALRNSALELAIAEGVAGEKLVRWAMERAAAPARLEPKTPLRFAARRIAWAPQGALQADASIAFERGPAVDLALAWRPGLLELRRATIKDARSDALLGATVAGDRIQASFSGTLHGQSIPAMLREPPPTGSGSAQGELRLTIDRKFPERTLGEGRLRIEALDLSWLAGKKAVIERAELFAEPTGVRIGQARFGWEDQFFDLSATWRRTEEGPVIEARVESAGVLLERLLPPVDPNAPRKKSSAFWPLPVSGRVELRAASVQYKNYRIEPFDGILSLAPRSARLEVKQARMCGVSFPMEIEMQPEQASAAAHIRIQNEPVERTAQCLTGGGVQLTGNADLKAELRVQGRRPHLLRGLTGTLEAELRQGRVQKFALLGNILSFRGIAAVGGMKENGFPYRSITAKGHFERGQFLVEEAFFDSDAVRLAASGPVDLLGANSQLTVLVGLLTRVDRIAGAIPLVGDVFGGSMTALPISVNGDIRDPLIVPLGPRAISNQLLGIFERTLKLPGKLVVPPQETRP